MKRRGQYSLEFLYTYGWAMAAILVVLGAIYTIGVFDFASHTPTSCRIFGQATCTEYVANIDAGSVTYQLGLRNEFDVGLNITGGSISSRQLTSACEVTPGEWPRARTTIFNFTGCQLPGGSGERVQAEIELRVLRPSSCPDASPECTYTIRGTIDTTIN